MRTLVMVLGLIAVLFTLACGGGGGGGGGGGTQTDSTPPTIGSWGVSPSLLTVGDSAQISATVSDAGSGVQSVLAVLTYPDNRQVSVALTLSGTTYQGSFTANWSGISGDLRVELRAVDGAGNRASDTKTVRLAGNPPSPPF
ncbi:MAG: hypothetical protein K6U12_02800 [Armatimonadetes bacterium]|jgi:hypothetical protein|nr:hypothetical protein [Armatimonadota bacterium]CUU38472.1 hypothetical protein DCOP10_125134 [Armatimonadetes bacterium DC]